jgi:1-acyl-sn-glycerol-3-phosphate acyltransferase
LRQKEQIIPNKIDESSRIRSRNMIRWPHLLYEYLIFYGLLAVFGMSSLLWSFPAALLYYFVPRRLGEPLGKFMIMAGFRYFVKVMTITGIIRCELTELDMLRRNSSLIIAPNHPTLLDAVLIISRLRDVTCIMKPAILNNPLLGGGARLAGYIRNDSIAKLIRRSSEKLRARHRLLIFPEGTRTVGGQLNHFKGGFALIAKKAGAPIQTVFIETNSPFLSKGWPLFRKPTFPLFYRVRLGKRFEANDDLQSFVNQLEGYYRQELSQRKESAQLS